MEAHVTCSIVAERGIVRFLFRSWSKLSFNCEAPSLPCALVDSTTWPVSAEPLAITSLPPTITGLSVRILNSSPGLAFPASRVASNSALNCAPESRITVWLEFCASAFAPPRAEAAPLADPCADAEEQINAVIAKDNTSRFIELPPKGLEMTWLYRRVENARGLDSMWVQPGDQNYANCIPSDSYRGQGLKITALKCFSVIDGEAMLQVWK